MAEKVIGGLKWVKGEIAMTLRRVRGLVETFARTGEPAQLGEAVDALFEVRGVLLALQLTLPARLVDEMQRLCDAMAERRVSRPREAVEALLLALIQLLSHLDQLDAGNEVPPLSLWPTINDLRASRGAPPVTPAELLVPGSVLGADEDDLQPEALEALAVALRKVRPHFHRHLVEWFGQTSSADGLVKLSRLFQQLHRFLKDGMLADLFRLAAAHAAGLQRGQVAADAAARALVGRLDRVFKPLVAAVPTWPETEIRELLDGFLTELDQADVQPALVAEIRAHYTRSPLETVLLPSSSVALTGLAETMLGEIAILKECLSLFLRGERDDRAPLLTLRSGARRLAYALEEAGSNDIAERLQGLAEGFGDLAQSDVELDTQRLEPLVGALLGIEALFQAQLSSAVPPGRLPAADRPPGDAAPGSEVSPGPGSAAGMVGASDAGSVAPRPRPAQPLLQRGGGPRPGGEPRPGPPVPDLPLIESAERWFEVQGRGGESAAAAFAVPPAAVLTLDLTELPLSGLAASSSGNLDPARLDPARLDPARLDPARLDPTQRDSDLADFFSQVPDEDDPVVSQDLRLADASSDAMALFSVEAPPVPLPLVPPRPVLRPIPAPIPVLIPTAIPTPVLAPPPARDQSAAPPYPGISAAAFAAELAAELAGELAGELADGLAAALGEGVADATAPPRGPAESVEVLESLPAIDGLSALVDHPVERGVLLESTDVSVSLPVIDGVSKLVDLEHPRGQGLLIESADLSEPLPVLEVLTGTHPASPPALVQSADDLEPWPAPGGGSPARSRSARRVGGGDP